MDYENIDYKIIALHNQEKWRDIVTLTCANNTLVKCGFSWVLPTLGDLSWLNDTLRKNSLFGVVSIGCGCGLMEWLLQKHSGLDIKGIELDKSWWCSKYSPPLFLKNIVFVDDGKRSSEFCVSEEYALLFCYFNNAAAFTNYVRNYKGNLILVIGPAEGQARSSDPLPFDEKFQRCGWKLIGERELIQSKDYITIYKRV